MGGTATALALIVTCMQQFQYYDSILEHAEEYIHRHDIITITFVYSNWVRSTPLDIPFEHRRLSVQDTTPCSTDDSIMAQCYELEIKDPTLVLSDPTYRDRITTLGVTV
jgi:hypothetical protein